MNQIFYTIKKSITSSKNKYFIELHDGRTIEIKDQISGIAPRKVFKAIGEMGIPFHEVIERHGAPKLYKL